MTTGDLLACPECGRPRVICVCDRVQKIETRHRLLILQHPQEQDVALGTAGLLVQALPRATLRVGLSWRSLAHALGEETERGPVASRQWAVLYPDEKHRPAQQADGASSAAAVTPAASARSPAAPAAASTFSLVDRHHAPVSPATIEGLVLLDGSWSQVKSIWWRNAWLLKLNRMSLTPREPSIYGALRKEPRRTYISTLEAAAAALTALGEEPEVSQSLLRLFRTLAQRARDARKAGLQL